MSLEETVALVLERNAFYRRQYLLALCAYFLSLIVICFLCFLLHFQLKNPLGPLYFATDEIGRLIDVTPLSLRTVSDDEVIAFAKEAVISTYTLDYVFYRAQIQGLQKYFTPSAWSNYLSAFNAALNLNTVTQNGVIFSAQVIGMPKIKMQGILNNSYAWEIEMPILVNVLERPYLAESSYNKGYFVTVTIQRQPIFTSYKGLGITQLLVETPKNTTLVRMNNN